jgi:serine/threonine protein kinase
LRIPQEDLEIGKYIGGGSFGALFRGVWKRRGGYSDVFIKKVVPNISIPKKKKKTWSLLLQKKIRTQEEQTVADICKELETMVALRFQHICQVHGACVLEDKEVWLVLEFVEGGNLNEFLTKFGPLTRELQLSLSSKLPKQSITSTQHHPQSFTETSNHSIFSFETTPNSF